MLTHGNLIGTLEAAHNLLPEQEHRGVSLLPLSHLLEQVTLVFYAMSVGAHVLYVRSRNPRVIFEAIRDHRTTTLVLVPQIIDLFWSAIETEVARQGKLRTFNRLRRVARRLPYPVRRRIFARVHRQFGGSLNLIVSAAAFLPPSLQQAWEDLGVVVMQGYGATECGVGSATNQRDHGLGTVGRTIPPVQVKLADDGEILVAGPTLFSGYWRDPETTAAAFTADGWYRTGDIGRHDAAGHLILMGRKKDIIVLPNGLNVYPEDVENALRTAGIRDSVVVEPVPGRIEAVVLAPGARSLPHPGRTGRCHPRARDRRSGSKVSAAIDAAVRAANRTLAVHQRVVAWRLWPDADFPRTHTFKVQRDRVRHGAAIDEPLPVREEDLFGGTPLVGPESSAVDAAAWEQYRARSVRRPSVRRRWDDRPRPLIGCDCPLAIVLGDVEHRRVLGRRPRNAAAARAAPTRGLRSARRPRHRAAAEQVDVQVVHGLAAVSADVHDKSVAVGGDPSRLASSAPTAKILPMRSRSCSPTSPTDAMCFRDSSRMCVGACGAMSRIATTESSE